MVKTAYKTLEEIFTNQITVLNIAVSTVPRDLKSAKKECLKNNFDVYLVQVPGKEDLQVYLYKSDIVRSINDSEVVSDSTPILEVLDALCVKEHLFVKVKRNITHLVTRSDLDSIPVRIWLYGMISLFEIELKAKIIKLGINWEEKVSQGRIYNAKKLFELKKSKNEEINLLGCTQLCDIGTILVKSWDQFKDYFPPDVSKKEAGTYFKHITDLRNSLAHGQKLQMKWPDIIRIAKQIAFSLEKL